MKDDRETWPRCPYVGLPGGEWCDGHTSDGLCPPGCSEHVANVRDEREKRLHEALTPDFQ